MFRHLNSLLSDINECTANVHNCDANAFCNNTEGSYKCTCSPGYDGNGISCTGKLSWPIHFSKKKSNVCILTPWFFLFHFISSFVFLFMFCFCFCFCFFWGWGSLKSFELQYLNYVSSRAIMALGFVDLFCPHHL